MAAFRLFGTVVIIGALEGVNIERKHT